MTLRTHKGMFTCMMGNFLDECGKLINRYIIFLKIFLRKNLHDRLQINQIFFTQEKTYSQNFLQRNHFQVIFL